MQISTRWYFFLVNSFFIDPDSSSGLEYLQYNKKKGVHNFTQEHQY